MTETVKKLAQEILAIIKESKSILLHCHPSPDPDSVGSALAMKFALEQLGKKATIIGGDSIVPPAFSLFPGFDAILAKNFFEIDLGQFDLFIIQDAGSLNMISRKGEVVFPETMKTIVIDHHASNEKYAKDINLVDISYPATAQMLFDLFKEWGIVITPDIAADLFMGVYSDTGGFKYPSTTSETLSVAAQLAAAAPSFSDIIFHMENSNTPGELIFKGIALSRIETFLGGHVAIAAVLMEDLQKKNLIVEDTSASYMAQQLKSVIGWDVGVGIVEIEPGIFKGSMRTRDSAKYDLSKIAVTLGGGGHKAAAGIYVTGTLAEAKQKIVDAVQAVLK